MIRRYRGPDNDEVIALSLRAWGTQFGTQFGTLNSALNSGRPCIEARQIRQIRDSTNAVPIPTNSGHP